MKSYPTGGMGFPLSVIFVLLLGSWCGSSFAEEKSAPLSFERDIRPVFRAHCFDCHGATSEKEGNLDLRLVRLIVGGGDSGPALVAGQPEESLLLQRVRDGEMPPGETHLNDEELETLEAWIKQGARTLRPEPETIGAGVGVALEDREFWSFQPIRDEQPPESSDPRVRTPIDRWVVSAMPDGLRLSNDADRATLVRRLMVDLVGLPPSSEEMQRWIADPRPDWYEHLVEELLASEHYGERWGRHWLDIAGYADSEGYTVADKERPWAWKYRDYVVRSFNADKPFDRFLVEQLAGDEIMGPVEGDLTTEQIELLTATGFLRMAADGTGSGANDVTGRNQVMADTIKIVSSSLLGLSVACAQCHDHRYDPIPQTDYYAMRAVFEPALDWQAWQTPDQRRVSLYTQADRDQSAAIETEAKQVSDERGQKQAEYMKQALAKELEKYEEPLREQLKVAYETAANERSDEQKALLKQYPSVNISPGVLYQYLPKAAEELKKLDQKIAEIRGRKPKEQFLRALREPDNHVTETRLFHRGDHQQPRDPVEPAGLTVTAEDGQRLIYAANDPDRPTTGRRLAFAQWLTSGNHPLVARVLVNRVWMHHFGRGLVPTPADFGKLGQRPSHPELLDWLATSFMKQGWSLKALHRQILLSTVWRQTAARSETGERLDPENRLYWRQSIRRLDAESLLDHMLAVTGKLDRSIGGRPVAISEDDSGQIIVKGGQTRRSLYVQQRRSRPVAMLQAFDAPVMETNCERRAESTVATQALMMMNGDVTLALARELAGKLAVELAVEPAVEAAKFSALAQKLPSEPISNWSHGYGVWLDTEQRLESFTMLPHWTGSAWQGGPELPDQQIDWAILHAQGGHPSSRFSVVRRWRIPTSGKLTFSGQLAHSSPNGDGVRARMVFSRHGVMPAWTAANSTVPTNAGSVEGLPDSFDVVSGDTVDLVVDCRSSVTSDSFHWTVGFELTLADGSVSKYSTNEGFHGPIAPVDQLVERMAVAWDRIHGIPPAEEELSAIVNFASQQLEFLYDHPERVREGQTAQQVVLENLCQVLLSSNQFLYVE